MPPVKLSPLMEQYYQNKKLYPDALLLFRVGDFYETFADDAVIVARDLNITLTSRQKDDQGEKIPLAGVPYHSLDAYLARLIRAGHKVAICDQVEDPKLARGLVKRAITRVVTPGTIIEPSMLDESSNNFLAAIVKGDENVGLAFVDVSTGEFLTTEVPHNRLYSELARFRPAECLSAFSLHWEGTSLQILEEPCFSAERAEAALADRYGPDWKERLRLEGRGLSQRACGAVLSYLNASRFDLLGHLKDVQIYSGSDYMVLDEVTVRNLEITRNIRDRSRRGTLLEFLDQTRTAMGARTLARWLQMPLQSEQAIARRLDGVEELASKSLLHRSLAEELKGTSDLERLLSRISCKSASPKELSVLKSTLEMLPRLQEILMDDQSSAQSSYLQDLSSRLSPLDDIVSLIERSIMEDPPVHVRDGGVIKEGYDPEIDQLRELLRDGRGWISRLEGSEKERTGIKSLKIAFNNVFGYYIEVSRANLHLVPQNYIRKQTLANGERFVTPELKDMESRVLSAQERSVSLEQELFYKVRDLVARKAGAIQERATALAELDVLISLATSAKENNMIRPEFNQEGRISIRSSRHPVLDKAMRGAFVPNDVLLDTDRNRLIILTGPNMAGKSTFMRQIALTAIMAQTGSFVPAAYASLSLVDQVFTRVGAYDDLSAGQSTFMVEMTEIAHILTSATRKSLVLLDEVGRGTSTFDGLSLAWAISEYLHESIKCKSVFATHYHQLTDLESILSGVRNYSIAVKEDKGTITFLRTVVPGATDKSYGVHVARLAGVPRTVTKRADQILREIEKEALMQPGSGGRSQRRSSRYTQLIFFDGNDDGNTAGEVERDKKDPILEEIESLDLDMMTPREALDRLAQYQRMQREREEG
ncbi:MAG TPA: DNA mismatch repair protein MutS [Methanothrix soehngenii]|uniref:DNA mismatch repair protein MutS n=1 Tax=Methanothrix soehngenii TaxID=2223 RepID=UPI002BA71D68|nr:DNA mismatch repair protein MutS [Methanothrix soehngenii]HOI19986.1 DNA mismatch repair protein MutS [Methanothrix soehngenii]